MGGIRLNAPLSEIPGIGQKFLHKLARLKLRTVRDLLWHFPARYEDFSTISKIADVRPRERVTVQGAIVSAEGRRARRKRMSLVEAVIADESGSIKAVWFNQPYLAETLRPGRLANFSGTARVSKDGELCLQHPAYEFTTGKQPTKHTGRLVPIYPETKGLTSRGFRFIIEPILKGLERLEDPLPREILSRERLPELQRALSAVHFPERLLEAQTAKRRFTFENLLTLQLAHLQTKSALAKEYAPSIPARVENLKRAIAALPFTLTFSQKKSLWEIIQDMGKPHPMNRLLQGDVGSGKTVVAALAALQAARAGCQTALMAPTEILAHQHFATFEKLAQSPAWEGIQISLLTGSTARVLSGVGTEGKITRRTCIERASRGDIAILIGTHALIARRGGLFRALGLVVIDEQHRFGVGQRKALLCDPKYPNTFELPEHNTAISDRLVPHFLSMSATPIPRTLMLTVFGDLDVSRITEAPAGRKRIVTKIVPPEKRAAAYEFIRKEVRSGGQAYVICPRVQKPQTDADRTQNNAERFLWPSAYSPRESALWDAKSAQEEYEKLSKKVFPDLRVEMLHGQLPAKKKNEVMARFKNGEVDVLVATSVIEVGIDVPSATVMLIEGSERFGLAQLYQFRGRVGRGDRASYCLLFAESNSAAAKSRLKAITEAKSGLELAERDLKLRGPGEFLGEEQSGFPDDAMEGLRDLELVQKSRAEARALLAQDPTLARFPLLHERTLALRQSMHLE